jgi:hypothetical protein
MKTKITFLFILILFSTISNSQSLKKIRINAGNDITSEKTKSGNFKDILSGFFQLASTNLSGDEKTIDFNSTLFALKAKANPELEIDTNYVKETFSRNLQFNFKANLNNDFEYTGFTGGVTYAPYNGRDKTMVEFSEKFDIIYNKFNNDLSKVQGYIVEKITSEYLKKKTYVTTEIPEEKKKQIAELNKELSEKLEDFNNNVINPYVNNKTITSTDTTIVNDFNKQLKNQNVNLEESSKEIHQYVEDFYKEVQSKALLTLAADGTANKDGKFDKASFGAVYLKGNKEAWNEIDLRAKFTYADTLITEHLPRTGLDLKAGVNFKIGKTREQQSYFEIKALGEYNKIFNNVLPDEDSEVITANAEIRIRVADDLWIPVVIKYDIENSNFLGFLNITYNFGI